MVAFGCEDGGRRGRQDDGHLHLGKVKVMMTETQAVEAVVGQLCSGKEAKDHRGAGLVELDLRM